MDKILKFDRVYYEKRSTRRINIENGILALNEHCKIPKIDETNYDYHRAVVELDQPDLCNLMKIWETEINEYLKGEGITPITILYGNRIYPKTIIHNATDASIIKIKSVWVNDENKPFPQLWLKKRKTKIFYYRYPN